MKSRLSLLAFLDFLTSDGACLWDKRNQPPGGQSRRNRYLDISIAAKIDRIKRATDPVDKTETCFFLEAGQQNLKSAGSNLCCTAVFSWTTSLKIRATTLTLWCFWKYSLRLYLLSPHRFFATPQHHTASCVQCRQWKNVFMLLKCVLVFEVW